MTSTTTTTTTTATESPATGTAVLPFQPEAMTPAQLAAVSYLARYSGHTHELYGLIAAVWRARTDRYSELRASMREKPAADKVEMYYIGG